MTDVNISPVVDQRGAAAFLGVAPKTLERWRWAGKGPPYVKLEGYLIRYRVTELEEYMQEGTVGR